MQYTIQYTRPLIHIMTYANLVDLYWVSDISQQSNDTESHCPKGPTKNEHILYSLLTNDLSLAFKKKIHALLTSTFTTSKEFSKHKMKIQYKVLSCSHIFNAGLSLYLITHPQRSNLLLLCLYLLLLHLLAFLPYEADLLLVVVLLVLQEELNSTNNRQVTGTCYTELISTFKSSVYFSHRKNQIQRLFRMNKCNCYSRAVVKIT